ncbi:ABC transporter substrate-binding protein [Streptomyces sp. 8L]|uniref:ABC transporter substrate-binding protein n=1 Tax=Streptomyces sp. 8L TaxID=2877242 RepID=UPI001CD6C7F5|nr:ABC transporter substrate-binding protein [Streptomyces sp. 8L]MCA1217173.1 ABC transporter substrate-binding protein [Streptomyces sp. 8L]
MKHKTLVLSAAVGLLAPVMAGCGDSGDGSDSGSAIVVGTTDHFTATKPNPAPFDPAFAYDTGSWNVLRQTLQTLTHVPRGGGVPVPEAASHCAFSNGNLTYSCTLRAGLKFANGDTLTAADVKYSLQRVLSIHDLNGAVGLLTNIADMDTSGRDIVFHLKSPDATFPYKLATPIAGIVNPKQYAPKKLRDGFEVDGSGPYTFKAEVKDNTLVKGTFTKNPTYKGDLKVQNNKVEMRVYPDAPAMGTALDKDDIDVMLRSMTPDQIKSLTDKPRKDINLTEMPGLEIRYIGFNTSAPIGKEKAIRQAMAYVVDRDKLINQVYGTTASPLYSNIPAGITGHTNSFFNQYGAQPSLSKAAQVLQSAGIHTPVKLTMNYTTDHYGAATAKEFQVLQSQFNDSKLFDVTIKGTPWKEFRPAETSGKYAVYGMGWFPDFPDPDSYVAPFFDKDNFLGSPYNNPQIRGQLIPKSRREADRGAASDTFGQIQDIVADDVPILPLWQGKQYVAARTDITGVEWAVDSSANYSLWELGKGTTTD